MPPRYLVVALLVPLFASGVRAEDDADPGPVTVAPTPVGSLYIVEGTVGDDPLFEVTRTILVEAAEGGIKRIRPVAMTAKGRAPTITVAYGETGSRTESWGHQELTGKEGAAVTLLRPPLTYLWGAVGLDHDRLLLGFATADGVRPVDEAFAHVRPFPTPGPAAEDPLHYHLWTATDLDLLTVLGLLPGAWTPNAKRTKERLVVRPQGAPTIRQTTEVRFLGTSEGHARFAFETTRTGTILEDGTWEVRRTTTGELHVDAAGGRLAGGTMASTAGWYTQNQKDPLVTIRHEATLYACGLDGTRPEFRDGVKRKAALVELRRTDPDALYGKVLQETYESAKALVLALRPEAKLDDVEVKLWDDDVDVGKLAIESKQLNDSPLALGILEATGPPLVELGLLSKATLEELENLMPGGKAGLPWAAAFAVPSRNLLLFKPAYATDVPIMAHELAHLASDRFGYMDRDVIGLGLERGIDPAWADLDGALAAWALGEAEAEVVEKAVAKKVTNPALLAFGLKGYVKNLKPPSGDADLFRHVMHLLYEASPKVVSHVYVRGDGLEKTLARAWKTYSYQTRQILFPDVKTGRSVLYPRGLALEGTGPIGATRLGSFSVQQAVARELGGTWEDADRLAQALEDDVLVRFETGMLWVSRWSGPEHAGAFAKRLASKLGGAAAIERREDATLVVTVGEVPDGEALATRLLKPLR